MKFSIVKFSLTVFSKKKAIVFAVIVFSISISLATSKVPLFVGGALEADRIWNHSLLMLSICYLTRAVCKLGRNHFSASLGNTVVTKLRLYCMDQFYQHDVSDAVRTYSLITYDIEKIASIISQQTLVFVEDFLVLCIAAISIAMENATIAILLAVESILVIALSLYYSRVAAKLTGVQRESITEITKVLYEATIVQKLIKTFNIAHVYSDKFSEKNKENAMASNNFAKFNRKYFVALEAILLFAILTCVSLVTYKEASSPATVITYYGYMLLFFNTSRSFSGVVGLYIDSKQSILRMKNTLSDSQLTRTYHAAADQDSIVCSRKDGKAFTFHRGEITCITGRNGSGKSTLLNSIIHGDNEYYNVSMPDGVQDIEISMQNCVFLDNTVDYNISLGRDCPKAWVDEIYDKLYISEIVDVHQDAFLNGDNMILSGGEQQRVCLARTLYSNPEVILIDDSLTAIDVKRRDEIIRFLASIKGNRFIVIVSSYPELIELADRVIEV